MLIPCPWCGERAHTEFAYGGDATVRRPARPDEASDSDWYAYLYLRQNPRPSSGAVVSRIRLRAVGGG